MPSIIESKCVAINLGRRTDIPGTILLVSTDLQARVRLEATVAPLGSGVVVRRAEEDPGEERPTAIVLDLDQVGAEGAARWAHVAGDEQTRVLGFFSHIDEDLGRAANELGIETFSRGRFWREAAAILADNRS